MHRKRGIYHAEATPAVGPYTLCCPGHRRRLVGRLCANAGTRCAICSNPRNVVDEMLRLTGVTKDDVVYDLGCGDGRLVITAAKRLARAEWASISIRNGSAKAATMHARPASLTACVFLEQDLFEADIRQATVVTLYLLPKLNVQLRPKLLRDLQPGTRVVSHDFDMAEWQPDQTVRVPGASRPHAVYYWVIPADVSGVWHVQVPAGTGERRLCVAFTARVPRGARHHRHGGP